jgi:hypothetical protein
MAKVKLVAESFNEYKTKKSGSLNEEQLNESSKGDLEKFLKNPEKNEDYFLSAYSAQFAKKEGQNLKKAVTKITLEEKKKLANQSLKAFADSSKGYAWLQVRDGKIVGAGALGVQKARVGGELGQ